MKRKNEAYWNASQQRWQINVQSDGVRKTFVSSKAFSKPTNKKGKLEAERKADKWLESRLTGENTRCSVLLDRYAEDVKSRTGTDNYIQTEKHIRLYIKPVIGHIKISNLTPGNLQDVLNKARGHGKGNTGQMLSKKTLMGIRGTMMSFLKYCRMHNYSTLFVEGLQIPSGAKRSKKTILQPDALKILFSDDLTLWRGKWRPEPFIHAYRFAVLTGFRPGELIGLQRRDVKDGNYQIRRSINRHDETTEGKNQNAIRSGVLGALAMTELEQQTAQLRAAGIVSPYIFPDTDGGSMKQQTYYKHWKRYCESHGFEEGTTPYELRHTWCSVNDELPDGLKKMVMGHSKSMDTNGVYGHQKKGDMEKAAAYNDAAFAPLIKAAN